MNRRIVFAVALVSSFCMRLDASTPVRKPSDLLIVYRECVVSIARQYVGNAAETEATRRMKLESTARALAQTARKMRAKALESGNVALATEWANVAEQLAEMGLRWSCTNASPNSVDAPSLDSLTNCTPANDTAWLKSRTLQDNPVDIFIDFVNASNADAANAVAARAGNLTTSEKATLFSLCKHAATTITNRLAWFSPSHASWFENNWRMELPKERMCWLLCRIFGLEDRRFQFPPGEVGADLRFMNIAKECGRAMYILRKREEDARVTGIVGRIGAMSAGELVSLAENESSKTVLEALSTNANDQVRLAVARNGEAPFALLERMRDDANSTVAEAAEKNLTYARSHTLRATGSR